MINWGLVGFDGCVYNIIHVCMSATSMHGERERERRRKKERRQESKEGLSLGSTSDEWNGPSIGLGWPIKSQKYVTSLPYPQPLSAAKRPMYGKRGICNSVVKLFGTDGRTESVGPRGLRAFGWPLAFFFFFPACWVI